MLLSIGRRYREQSSDRDSIHNYYEKLVIEQALRSNDRCAKDTNFLADVACVALNRLPPRYVRHDVDMTFFLTPTELDSMTERVVLAVNEAANYVESRQSSRSE